MTEQENLLKVKEHLTAIEQGNIEKAVSYFDEQVDFQSPVSHAPPQEISWAGPRKGRQAVEAYYREMNDEVRIENMEPRSFMVKGDKVIVEGTNTCTVKSTENTYRHEWIMVMELSGGKFVRSYQYFDTADILPAYKS